MLRRMAFLTVLCATLLALWLPQPALAQGKNSYPKNLVITYCWQSNVVDPLCPQQDVTLNKNGSATTVIDTVTYTGSWNTSNKNKSFTLTFANTPDGTTIYQGTKQSGGGECYAGTMSNNTLGISGSWAGCVQ